MAAHETPVRTAHCAVISFSGAAMLRRSMKMPTQLENVNARELASAMPFILMGSTSAAENASVPATLAPVMHMACLGSDRANSARITTVEQAMPGRPSAE